MARAPTGRRPRTSPTGRTPARPPAQAPLSAAPEPTAGPAVASTSAITGTVRPTGNVRTTKMVFEDVSPSFWNAFNFKNFGPGDAGPVSPAEQVQVDALVGVTYEVAADNSITVKCGASTDLTACWVLGTPHATLTLPNLGSTPVASIRGLRFTYTYFRFTGSGDTITASRPYELYDMKRWTRPPPALPSSEITRPLVSLLTWGLALPAAGVLLAALAGLALVRRHLRPLRAAAGSHSRSRRSWSDSVSVDSAEAAMRTGRATMSAARSEAVTMTAAAPSPAGASSKRLTGSAVMGAPANASGRSLLRYMARGLAAALAWALTLNPAKSASASPFSCM